MPRPVITLLTDFGNADYFVGALKGTILSLCRDAQIVDITHEVPPQDIAAGAFTLLAVYKSFPAQTVHIAVVDPGVGSARRPILATAAGQFFVGPDNGIFSYLWELDPPEQVFHIQSQEFFRQPVSATFHGRDIFAPVAAALANGVDPSRFGPEISDWVRLEPLSPVRAVDGLIHARVIHIDRFGNCVTNLTKEQVTDEMVANGLQLSIKGREIHSFQTFFAEAGADQSEEVFAIWGSAGFLEIAAPAASAARVLDVSTGQRVVVSPAEEER